MRGRCRAWARSIIDPILFRELYLRAGTSTREPALPAGDSSCHKRPALCREAASRQCEGINVTLANRITMFRIILIPVFLITIMSYTPEKQWLRHLALFVYIVAAVSDAVDGIVARAFDQKTKLGAVLDPLADKLLVNLGFVFLAVNPHFETQVPGWLPVILLSRDISLAGFGIVVNHYYGPVVPKPRVLGKITMVVQSASVLGVLFEVNFAWELLMVMLFFTIVSWIDYTYIGLRKSGDEDGN